MRSLARGLLVSLITIGASFASGSPSARAQGVGLGGYGAMAGGSGPSMIGGNGAGTGMGSGTVAPFGGRFGTAMPSAMGGGGGLSFRPRPSSTMSNTRTAFTIGPMGGGMSGGLGEGSGRRSFVLPDLGRSGLGGDPRRMMPAVSGKGVMPPSFGYPFRQPPSLVPSSSGAALSM